EKKKKTLLSQTQKANEMFKETFKKFGLLAIPPTLTGLLGLILRKSGIDNVNSLRGIDIAGIDTNFRAVGIDKNVEPLKNVAPITSNVISEPEPSINIKRLKDKGFSTEKINKLCELQNEITRLKLELDGMKKTPLAIERSSTNKLLIDCPVFSQELNKEIGDDITTLNKYINRQGQIIPRIYTKLSAKDQHECIVPVFALVREVIRRQIGLLLFPTQIFGGLVLHEGNIAQMNTGEGKTLTAFLPICLNALTGKSVFVVTVNEYLAQLLDFFGIPSGVNLRDYSAVEKKDLYHNCTVIYTTSSELGFDYLRNNLVTNIDEKQKQDYYYAIIDEVDSILIDEAQNPLIISRPTRGKGKIHPLEYQLATKIASLLVEKKDYIVDQKDRITKEKLILIDLLTGRLALNRVYGSGIHQAIESKENLLVTPPSKNIATITYQNFFRLFTKLSGMTGTAESETKEFREVYGMEVIVIPPYRKLIRKDHEALFFLARDNKYRTIVRKVKKNSQTQKRPVLVGSPSLEVSEHISQLLTQEGIFHQVLNATNHELEAQIISQAGEMGSVIVSTNMVGRGVDIPLSKESKEAGGLMVIIVEPNSVLRPDQQFRGRAGRQGPKVVLQRPFGGKVINLLVSEAQETLRNIQSDHRQRTLNRDLLINRQRKITYHYREKILTGSKLEKLASLPASNNFNNQSEHLRSLLLRHVDNFWSEYLECLDKIDELTKISCEKTKSARTRFAPSPTGDLHLGGARTALFNYLVAKQKRGQFILRIEDTDQQRNHEEFVYRQYEDLRLDIYQKYLQQLLTEKKAYYCFCSAVELTQEKERYLQENQKSNYQYSRKCLKLTLEEVNLFLREKKSYLIRFHTNQEKNYQLIDLVRGQVVFPGNDIEDFVLCRSNGVPLLNFAVVVDDHTMEINYILRGEEHLSNTAKQLVLYEALG
ncbi:15954_t:CDS:2, partial [Racocetra fulgida]